MAKKSIKIFVSISIVFYFLVGFYVWYSVSSFKGAESKKAEEVTSLINTKIESAYSVDNSFSSKYFLKKVDEIFGKFPSLSGIILDTGNNQLQYVHIKDQSLLKNSDYKAISAGTVPQMTASHPLVKISSSNLYTSGGLKIHTTLIFNFLDRKVLFPVLRNSLIIILAFLALTLVVYFTTDYEKADSDRTDEEEDYRDSYKDNDDDSTEDFESSLENDDDDDDLDLSLPDDINTENNIIEDDIISDEPEDSESETSKEELNKDKKTTGMYSDRSGLVWGSFLQEKLDAELKRAASFYQDSCFVVMKFVSPSGIIPYKNISELIINHFQYKDLAFESGDHTFCIIIPDKDIDEGIILVERFIKNMEGVFSDSEYRIYAGMTSRNGRLLDHKRMIKEAKIALSKAEFETKSTTIAFRSDPDKYRNYIASKELTPSE
ncbi:MAG: hypothetical protein PQJ46_03680 [Spirochaetales bacterium]|nr:hypothetical protein [Spirochaetales bacterium]